ncbi:Putative uncharacterized protein [Halomonas sp. R57-5]|uniref:hypothetical protein n=1 Tax=Halomonas sp. R57-5 TaxID=1610576 RepID=UPI0005FC6258|nr:hypothetical protein [Halomonas sp. R57-5]CEP36848.1 Putative uncharacterized protein [Halomonas sp. R57-5]
MKTKIKSPLQALTINLTITLLTILPILLGFDLTIPELSDEMKRRFGQAAALLSFIGALLLSYHFLQFHRYKKQEEKINIEKHKLLLEIDIESYNLHSAQQKKELEDKVKIKNKELSEESGNILKPDTTVNLNMALGFVILAIAALMQVISAG